MSTTLYVPTVRVDTIDMGITYPHAPKELLLLVNSVIYSSGYFVDTGGYQQRMFPAYSYADNKIIVKVILTAASSDMPSITYPSIEVLIID